MAALADGDDSGARAVLESAWSECAEGKREFCGHYLVSGLVGLGTLHGDSAPARRAFEAITGYLCDRPGPAMHRSAAFASAILDADVDHLLQVADDYAAAGRPLLRRKRANRRPN